MLVAGILSPVAAPAELLRWWHGGAFDLIVSPRLLGEIRRVLTYPKIRRRIDAHEASRLLEMFDVVAIRVDDPDDVPAVCRDPNDDYLFAVAAAHADVLVSGDKDVLETTGVAVRVLSPAGFAEILGKQWN